MSLEVLKQLAEASGDENVLNAYTQVEQSFKSNVEKIGFLEKDLQKSIEKRDGIKNSVKTKLGLEDVSDESLDEFLKKIQTNPDEAVKAENTKLSQLVEALKAEKDGIVSKYQSEINDFRVDRMLSDIGGRNDTETPVAYDILLGEIKKGASFDENGNIVFKAGDGTTLRNSDGTPMSLKDRYNAIKEDENFSFLFKGRRSKAGSGAQSGKDGGGQTGLNRSKMTHAEKAEYISKHGQDAYLKLPN